MLFNRKTLKTFPLKSRIQQGDPLSLGGPPLCNKKITKIR